MGILSLGSAKSRQAFCFRIACFPRWFVVRFGQKSADFFLIYSGRLGTLEYALLVKPHPNARYNESLQKLALLELQCLLWRRADVADCRLEQANGYTFLALDCERMNDALWRTVSAHSSVCFAAERQGELLRPIALDDVGVVGTELAQTLKYKGKTNADFTRLLLNCTRAASAFAEATEPLTVLDPMCGRGTSLYCAWHSGDHAVGLDVDAKALHEADVYLSRCLQFQRRKHKRDCVSRTLPEHRPVKEICYTLADATPARTLRLMQADAALAGPLLRREGCHLVVTDLPYGVQHAPHEGDGIPSLERLLHATLPPLASCLRPGGAVGLSFNTYTLPRRAVEDAMRAAGLAPMTQPPFHDFAHWVEQAVNRDLVIGTKF